MQFTSMNNRSTLSLSLSLSLSVLGEVDVSQLAGPGTQWAVESEIYLLKKCILEQPACKTLARLHLESKYCTVYRLFIHLMMFQFCLYCSPHTI